jgi:hypothetical protein
MVKAAFMKEMFFIRKFGLNLRNKLAMCNIWSIALCGAESWQLLKLDQKYLESFEIWYWRSMEKVIWTDRARNEALR